MASGSWIASVLGTSRWPQELAALGPWLGGHFLQVGMLEHSHVLQIFFKYERSNA